MESLLTLHIENQYAVTHFKNDTFTLYEYAVIFGTSVAEAVKRVSNCHERKKALPIKFL